MENFIQAKRLNHLDVYKGIFIIFVIITHFAWTDIQEKTLLFPFWIVMAVPCFMIITGYVSSISFEKKGTTVLSAYSIIEIMIKWMRFIIPFIPAWLLTVIARIVGHGENFSAEDLILDFLVGGEGRGSYYFPVMLQIVLIMPLIWWVVKKHTYLGLGICFATNVFFELCKTLFHMTPELYRLCSFRYIFALGFGCFLFYCKIDNLKKRICLFLLGLVGVVYIIIFNYTNAKPTITSLWTTTSVFSTMYLLPIMAFLFSKDKIHNKGLELLGKASFNIFLVQMVFFLAGDEIVYKFIPTIPLQLCVIVITCCAVGIIFYKIENPITHFFIKFIRSRLDLNQKN